MGTMGDRVDRYFEWRKRRPMQRTGADGSIVKVDVGPADAHQGSVCLGQYSC